MSLTKEVVADSEVLKQNYFDMGKIQIEIEKI